MFDLSKYGLNKNQIESLNRKGVGSIDALLATHPIKYYYFDNPYPLYPTDELLRKISEKEPVAVIGTCTDVEYEFNRQKKMSLTKIRVKEPIADRLLFINIIGQYKMTPYYQSLIGKRVIVGGHLQYSDEYHSFSMMSPIVFTDEIEKFNRIVAKHRKYRGITDEYLETLIHKSTEELSDIDYVPYELISQYGLSTHREACRCLHFPKNMDEIEKAEKRFVFDDLFYFSCKLAEQDKLSMDSPNSVSSRKNLDELMKFLPYELTDGQKKAINDMYHTASEGKRISALIQGDVGSGKTIVAIAMMLNMAENGYQSVLMAPTTVLASQHYKEISQKAEAFGFKACLLSNELKAAEKKKNLEGIKNGEYQLIVGTHACIVKDVIFDNLALTITDEEHRFGVVQRDALVNKGAAGVHNIIMSGTPIPRTLANTLYGNNCQVYSMELPAGRKPIKTEIFSSDKEIFELLKREIAYGRQGYIVAPLIEDAEDGTKLEGVASVEQIATKYAKFFNPLGISTAVITGKTPKDEQAEIIRCYANNEIKILIATTVIEVGINVPNATVMVITGAERFGLATLHQLRGRVGRGEYQSYCILQKSPAAATDAHNMSILCSTNDGLEIAKADLLNRGTGNIVGIEQSGRNKFIDLMLTYPNMYSKIRAKAEEVCKTNTGKHYIQIYEELYL